MKIKLLLTSLTTAAALCATGQAQVTADTPRDNSPAAEPSSQLPPATLPAPPVAKPNTNAPAATRVGPKAPPPNGAITPPNDAPAVVEDVPTDVPVATAEQDLVAEEEGGWRINDASLNNIFQFLAKAGERQYFHNMKITGPEFRVTGHLNDGDPLQQMEDLAFMYGLTLYTKGDTIYALTEAQLNQLPSAEFHYQLHYLRPTDIDQIKELIKPVLSPGTGIVNFEPKTNTIVIIDSAHHIEMARELLHSIDKAKGQIVVETKIMRINSGVSERIGVDWSSSLGETGTSIEVAKSLNSVFGLGSDFIEAIGRTSGNSLGTVESSLATNSIVLSPVQLNGVLRALSEGGFASQISNPTLITEDNEMATISIIDRVPIITATVNQTQNANNITEEVRYKIDPEDPTIATDPENQREIGISLVVTPTLLPDGTIRMRLRPRSAQIVDEIQGQSGNYYPRVTEAMIESITRVPDSYSLVIGGFYGEIKKENDNKVPILGDVPLLNFFFKSNETVKEQTSLVFIVTPTSYDPTSAAANSSLSNRVHSRASMPGDNMWIDPELNPGPAHDANMRRTLRGVRNQVAPYYPTAAEQENAGRKASNPQPVRSSKPRFNSTRRR